MVTHCFLFDQALNDASELLCMRGDRQLPERTTTKHNDSQQEMAEPNEVSSCGCL